MVTAQPIPEFPNYSVSPDGKIYKDGKEKIVSCKKGRSAKVIIRKNKKMYTLGLALLVARLYIPNPHHHSKVIFKDRNHHNCRCDNIAWVDGETFMFYACPTGRGRPKTYRTREFALAKTTDTDMRNYYETLDEEWLVEAWQKVDREMAKFPWWKLVMAETYLHFLDRARRFSILGKPVALMWFYAKGEYLKFRKEISPDIPNKKLVQTDESLRNRKLCD